MMTVCDLYKIKIRKAILSKKAAIYRATNLGTIANAQLAAKIHYQQTHN